MTGKTYKYDLHTHTSEASKCGKLSGRELVSLYAGLGYDGIVVTDHFFNGNTCIDAALPWEERVGLFCSGYEEARDEGERQGLSVFFGFESNFGGTEILAYGLGREFLLANPDIHLLDCTEFCARVREAGGFLSQAHPFRDRKYIKDIRLFLRGEVDAFEVVNASHTNEKTELDRRADFIAASARLFKTAGSDTHYEDKPFFSGLEFNEKIKTQEELIAAVKSGAGRVFVIKKDGTELDDIYLRPKKKAQAAPSD